jgi:hypothetical protein
MQPRLMRPHLYPEEAPLQTTTQDLLPTQILSTIIEASQHLTFGDIPKVEVLCPTNNASTTTIGLSQHAGGASSTQNNGGTPH